MESQFTLIGITLDATKYAHVLAQLDTKYAREVKDIITNPPAADRYATIKKAFIKRVSASEEQRTRQLLEHEELGDRKPSQFLRHLQTLVGIAIPEQLLRTLWLGRLPPQIQIILATRTRDPLEEVAAQADRIQEVSSRTVAEVNEASGIQSMSEQISKLTLQVAELAKQWRQPYKQSRRERSRSREKKKEDGPCYFHRCFKERARKCAPLCNYTASNKQGNH